MKRSKTLSFFKIGLILTLNACFRDPFFFLASVFLISLSDIKEAIVLVLLMITVILYGGLNDFIPYGYIESKTDNYVIVDKILYKTKVYTKIGDIGDFVDTYNHVSERNDNDNIKNNIRFINRNEVKIISDKTPLKWAVKHLNSLDDESHIICERYLFNTYSNESGSEYYLGYGFSFYYFLKLLLRKNRFICFLVMTVYIVLFGFEIKFYLIIADLLLSFIKHRNIDCWGIKLIIISIINVRLISNHSLLLPLLLGLITYLDFNNKFTISVVQSVLFGTVNLFMSFLFSYYVAINIMLFMLSLLLFTFPFMSKAFLFVIHISSYLMKLMSFNIRGKISLLTVFILIVLNVITRIKNTCFYTTVLIFCLILPINNPLTHVSFIDVGQGDSILLKGALGRYTVLIDTGSKYNYSKLRNHLYDEGIYKLDYLIISHDDSDHNGNIEALKKNFRINMIIDSPQDISINGLFLDNIYLGEFDNDNDNSLIYHTELDGHTFLFTGDISDDAERLFIKNSDIRNIDVLKVSHHGSRTATSSYFIGKILPRFAVISTDGSYGHPHDEVILTLDSFRIRTYITKDSGTVSFYLTGAIDFVKTDNNDFDIIIS